MQLEEQRRKQQWAAKLESRAKAEEEKRVKAERDAIEKEVKKTKWLEEQAALRAEARRRYLENK